MIGARARGSAAQEKAPDRIQVLRVFPLREQRAVPEDPLRVALLEKGVVVPASLPSGAVRHSHRDPVQSGVAASGVPVDDRIAPGQVDVQRSRPTAVGLATGPEHAVLRRLCRASVHPQTEGDRIVGDRRVEHPLRRVRHGHRALARAVQGSVAGQAGAPSGVGTESHARKPSVPAASAPIPDQGRISRVVEVPESEQSGAGLGLVEAQPCVSGGPSRIIELAALIPAGSHGRRRGNQDTRRGPGGHERTRGQTPAGPERDVGPLRLVAVLAGHGDAVGSHQRRVAPRGRQGEVRMEWSSGVRAILARREYQQPSVGREIPFRETPSGESERGVGQEPPGQVHRRGSGVVDLDPIGRIAVFVPQTAGVAREAFADDRRGDAFTERARP